MNGKLAKRVRRTVRTLFKTSGMPTVAYHEYTPAYVTKHLNGTVTKSRGVPRRMIRNCLRFHTKVMKKMLNDGGFNG